MLTITPSDISQGYEPLYRLIAPSHASSREGEEKERGG
jgi:hypothetical protein